MFYVTIMFEAETIQRYPQRKGLRCIQQRRKSHDWRTSSEDRHLEMRTIETFRQLRSPESVAHLPYENFQRLSL